MADRPTGSKVFTGARAIFKIGDMEIAYATEVSGSEEILRQEIEVLGRLAPLEYAETGYRVTLRCRGFRTIPWSEASKGEGTAVGHPKKSGIFPKYDDILTSGEMTVTVYDKITNEVIANYINVKAATRNWTVGARTVFSEDITFVGERDISGET